MTRFLNYFNMSTKQKLPRFKHGYYIFALPCVYSHGCLQYYFTANCSCTFYGYTKMQKECNLRHIKFDKNFYSKGQSGYLVIDIKHIECVNKLIDEKLLDDFCQSRGDFSTETSKLTKKYFDTVTRYIKNNFKTLFNRFEMIECSFSNEQKIIDETRVKSLRRGLRQRK